MHWRTMRWKDWDAKCSCGNTKPRCQRNLHWRRKLAAHGNCWNNKRNRVGCHGRLGDKTLASVCGGRAGKWSGERRVTSSETEPKRNAACPPQTEACRSCGPVNFRSGRARGLRRGTGVVVRVRGPTGSPWSRVRRWRCRRPLPSEPDVRLSPHPAQAISKPCVSRAG